MTADAVAPCVARASAAMILALWNRQVLILNKKGFQLPVSSQCGGMIFGLRVLSSAASVGLCVGVCVNHELVRTITHRSFKLGSPNLDQRRKTPWYRSLLFFWDDRPWPSRSNSTWKSIFTSFWACLHHNSSAVQARFTKLRPKMHLSTGKILLNFGLDWFWSSLSFSILKPNFLPNLFALFCIIFSETPRLLPEASIGLRVLSLPACVCMCLSVHHELFRAIIHQPFKLGSPNLDQRCKRPWLRSLLFCGVIDGDLQGQIELEGQNLPHFSLVSLSGR